MAGEILRYGLESAITGEGATNKINVRIEQTSRQSRICPLG